jgi:hypothetical protein
LPASGSRRQSSAAFDAVGLDLDGSEEWRFDLEDERSVTTNQPKFFEAELFQQHASVGMY